MTPNENIRFEPPDAKSRMMNLSITMKHQLLRLEREVEVLENHRKLHTDHNIRDRLAWAANCIRTARSHINTIKLMAEESEGGL